MKTLEKNLLALFLMLAVCSSINAQKFPIVLTQKLPWAPGNIVANSTKEITVVYDTANYIAVVTYGTLEEADSLRFPEGKINLNSEGRKLTFSSKDFPYNSGISVHTTSKNLILDAKEYSTITLKSASDEDIHLNTLTLNAENGSIIEVVQNVVAGEAYITAKDYGWIRYRSIEAKNKKTNAYGAGRVIEIGGDVDESILSYLVTDKRYIPLFMNWSFGTSTLSTTPFGGFNSQTGNFIWGSKPMGYFSFALRWAFFQKPHWDISAGFGMKAEIFQAENSYLTLNTDTTSGITSFEAVNSSALLAQEEQRCGKILWNSTFSVTQIIFPIRLEWHARNDYKGLNIGGELRPGFTYSSKSTILVRNGFYADTNSVAYTKDETIGKYFNPFHLGIRLSVGYNRVSVFAETALTPLFRTRNDKQQAEYSLDRKLYPFSIGVCFTL